MGLVRGRSPQRTRDIAIRLDPDVVATTIAKMKSIDTVWGKGRWGGKEYFGDDHCIVRPFRMSRIVNGKVDQLDFIEK
jgi:hypothetical protein